MWEARSTEKSEREDGRGEESEREGIKERMRGGKGRGEERGCEREKKWDVMGWETRGWGRRELRFHFNFIYTYNFCFFFL